MLKIFSRAKIHTSVCTVLVCHNYLDTVSKENTGIQLYHHLGDSNDWYLLKWTWDLSGLRTGESQRVTDYEAILRTYRESEYSWLTFLSNLRFYFCVCSTLSNTVLEFPVALREWFKTNHRQVSNIISYLIMSIKIIHGYFTTLLVIIIPYAAVSF